MNPDSITKLTSGLFDGVSDMKSVKNYSYDRTNDFKNVSEEQYKKMNNIHMNMDIKSDEESPLFRYPKEAIKEYKEELSDEYDRAVEAAEDAVYEKHNFDLLPEEENPLKEFYNEIINEKALERLDDKERKKMTKRKAQASKDFATSEFDKVVSKVAKRYPEWSKDFDVFNYIVRDGKKFKVVGSKKEMDKSTRSTTEKLRYLDKLVRKSKFTEQVVKKYIEKYNIPARLIDIKDIDAMEKFYRDCLVKAFEKKIRYTRKI